MKGHERSGRRRGADARSRHSGDVGGAGAGAGVAAATIRAVLEGAGTQGRTGAATVGSTYGAE